MRIIGSAKHIITLILAAVFSIPAVPAADKEVSVLPQIYGTLRPRYEWVPDGNDMRFQIRNARIGFTGHIAPIIDYRAEVDLSERGTVKCLDVWGRVALSDYFKVQLGGMRLPFTFGSYRAPHVYLFADRPFVDKQLGSPRNAGVKLIYAVPHTGLDMEGGVFNSGSYTLQGWQERMAVAGKVRYRIDNVTLLGGYQSLAPDTIRMNHWGAGVSWQSSRWMLEGEYVYCHYTNHRYKDAHGYNFMVDYAMPVKIGYFNRLSFQGRLDGLTDYSDGKEVGESGALTTRYHARNRITVGATLSYVHPKVRTDFRLNYEEYIYHHDVVVPVDERSKFVAELVIHF